jgi:hypothetical protein
MSDSFHQPDVLADRARHSGHLVKTPDSAMRREEIMERVCLVLAFMIIPMKGFAHKGHGHSTGAQPGQSASGVPEKLDEKTLAEINEAYVQAVKPIFQKKCFDCHSHTVHYPWYYSIPGVRGMIDRDIAEGREHLDFSHDFPFGGHGSPTEDLDAIKETLSEGDMPPLRYQLMHRESGLTAQEKKTILDWIERSQGRLK